MAQNQPLKNIDRLLVAYQKIPVEVRHDLVLIIPGYKKSVSISGVRVIYEKQSAEALANWYRGAIGFVFPSLRESFGLPILEAMACGCPVMTSDNSACKEIAGDAAILVNPRDEKMIISAMLQLANDAKFRDELRSKGLKRAKQFTWHRSAMEHLKEFHRAINTAKAK